MVYIRKREPVIDPERPNGHGVIVEYVADNSADIASLKGGSGSIGSTVFVIATSEVYMLGSNGWVKI